MKRKEIINKLNKIRNLRTGFKIILGYIILNLIVLTIGGNWSEDIDLYFGKFFGDVSIVFSMDHFLIGIIFILIYWFLWGHKKEESK
tara:strand:+ start:298 stop:558 length:261 start_codon:yes stop_codon:yes gene_type:complete